MYIHITFLLNINFICQKNIIIDNIGTFKILKYIKMSVFVKTFELIFIILFERIIAYDFRSVLILLLLLLGDLLFIEHLMNILLHENDIVTCNSM